MSTPIEVRSGQFRYQQYTLAYELYGADGGMPCILVHGILLDSLLNRALARRFAALGYQVALIDLLGHGKSDRSRDPKEHRVDFYADQVLALLDHLGWSRAVVGGVSLGCITALTVAVKAPQRCAALFLEMPVMEWSAPWAALILSPLLVASRYNQPVQARIARLIGRLPRPPVDWLASAMNAISNDPRVVAAILHGVLVGPIVPTLAERRRLTMPVLIIGHSGDKLHEHRDARSLATQLPNARLLMARSILELRTRPARLWPQIEAFMRAALDAEAAPAAVVADAPRAAPRKPAARKPAVAAERVAARKARPAEVKVAAKAKAKAPARKPAAGKAGTKRAAKRPRTVRR
ncbi:alpha/beta fold hydrolase [Solimonas variicoloris]|uniref:alpha/beta fold hydrolase n=1 Tax=Solimonas variicoloris TaxID=254408 RepID=UPI00037704F7|nr:alpha/beta hydrolase [Solimonas variicoloris]